MNKTTKIYLAGKITKNGWRQTVCDIRNEVTLFDIEEGATDLKTKEIPYNDHTVITGPFFISCDHGCFHGENTHGVQGNGCYELTFTETEVMQTCLHQIDKSDIVFAYIDSNDCFGTLCEIGHAHAQGKQIIILFDTEQRRREMWFAAQMANVVAVQGDKTVKQHFDKLI